MKNGIKFFFLGFLFSVPFFLGLNIFQEKLENFFYAQVGKPFEEIVIVKIERPKKPELKLNVKSALSLKINNAKREKILFEKDSKKILPIASLTKLMTAIIVLENYDFEKTLVTISQEAANQENVPNYGNLDKKVGGKFNLEQLLDLMLIYSSNDAAWALAEVIGVQNFIEKMNQKAKELELENTHFVNPHGLDPENLYFEESPKNFNYSTTKDLVKISQYILKEHPLIFNITKKEPLYQIENGIFNIFLTEKMIGGKTGYTKKAGGNLLLVFQNQKGSVFVNVILGAESEEIRIKEMQKLLDWLNLN